ncbi:MAG: glycosyltransferase [Candidatus Paceibacterota bacterium]|jgi:glycosyltransferase involved in cell wall biosynthesis
MKTKLLICITKSNWGGAQKYVFDMATNIPKNEFDVSVLLGGDGELKRRLDAFGIRTVLLGNSQRDIDVKKEFSLFFELLRLFRKERPDIVHLNSSKMGGTGALAARLAGVKKVIFTGHGWAFNEDRNFVQKLVIRILHIITVLLSSKTIAVSETTKRQLGRFLGRKIVVIRNGLREINFKEQGEARKELSEKILVQNKNTKSILGSNPVWIGTISELHKTKGLNYCIEAISKIKKNVIFVIIGEGKERKKLEEIATRSGVSARICMIGRVEQASIYLKAFDIFTLTSITEALPYCLLEAGWASLPTIASGVGGIPEIIEDGKTGLLVQPKNPETIKSAIENLLQNPDRASSFGKSLKEKIENEFKINDMIQKTINIYKI